MDLLDEQRVARNERPGLRDFAGAGRFGIVTAELLAATLTPMAAGLSISEALAGQARSVQTLYVGADGLLKRHDYDVEIARNTAGAHYFGGYTEVQGIKFPTERRIYPRQPDGQRMPQPLVVSIDLSDIRPS
ncbi:hypothetical protein [Rhizobium ruizarguesonis]|uniref:hypothetical protein n=1 Tax=Rhizobium ruizarguesonis TaxID=2081791 RepID=UPI002961EF54|nr:hypothetical protein [Rhizobium ruizarguesonis]